MLHLQGYAYKDLCAPAPRNTIGKARFKSPAEARCILGNKFNWPGSWIEIERARPENEGRRPTQTALD